MVQESTENRRVCSSGGKTVRGISYDNIIEAWSGIPQAWPQSIYFTWIEEEIASTQFKV